MSPPALYPQNFPLSRLPLPVLHPVYQNPTSCSSKRTNAPAALFRTSSHNTEMSKILHSSFQKRTTISVTSTGNESFTADTALPLPSQFSNQYNIFCHHTRWNKKEVENIMPKDTIYVSILREPAAMYESLYGYFRLDLGFGVPLTEFISRPEFYYYNESLIDEYSWIFTRIFGRNPMTSDFGIIGDKEQKSLVNVYGKINEIQQRFSLIMIADQMEESLVLLRDLLCWKWRDVVAFRVNKRIFAPVSLDEETKEKIRAWNKADLLMYKHFLLIFEKRKEQYGLKKLAKDVKKLRRITATWREWCLKGDSFKNKFVNVTFGEDEFEELLDYPAVGNLYTDLTKMSEYVS